MKVPFLQTVLTLRDHLNEWIVPQLDSQGRLKVNLTNAIAPSVGATPPSTPSTGDLWLDTTASQYKSLYFYDEDESAWLSTELFPIHWGEDTADGSELGWAGINGAGLGTRWRVPKDMLIVGITAAIRTGNTSKQIELTQGGTVTDTFTLSGGVLVDNDLSISINAGVDLWVQTNGTGANVSDIAMTLFARWRV